MQNTVFGRIRRDLDHNDVVLYMKGTAAFPLCGFSAAIVQILSQMGIPFKDVNVLEDNDIRQGVKNFSNWPTIPQLYIRGQFVGGCDIVRHMFETGALQFLLEQHGLISSRERA